MLRLQLFRQTRNRKGSWRRHHRLPACDRRSGAHCHGIPAPRSPFLSRWKSSGSSTRRTPSSRFSVAPGVATSAIYGAKSARNCNPKPASTLFSPPKPEKPEKQGSLGSPATPGIPAGSEGAGAIPRTRRRWYTWNFR